MSIIVAGKLIIKPTLRDDFIQRSNEAIILARKNDSCLDYAVSPDPINTNRVNIFEKWKSQQALNIFREAGPETDIFTLVKTFDINEYEVKS